MTDFLIEGPTDARLTILLAHGAGAPMDSNSMTAATAALVAIGFRVARFEFDYMASRRTSGSRKPQPKAQKLILEYRLAIESLDVQGPLIIGGKSIGGRVASMMPTSSMLRQNRRLALPRLSTPPSTPKSLRTQHLETIQTPTLICQGTRDEFGNQAEVADFALSDRIEILWLEDGDHDLKTRKTVSGFTVSDHLASMATVVKRWTEALDA